MCVPGSYSAAAGSSSASVCGACEAGHYCPDPGQRYPCPNHTASTAGSASQLGCKCKKGAICLYARQLQVSVILPVSLGRWLSDAGLRASAVRAIAMSAGTNESSVWLARAAAAFAVPRGHRRLLERSPHHTVVRAAVQNGEAFHGLEALLGEAHPGLRDARVHWTPGSRVRVLGGTAFSKGIPYI